MTTSETPEETLARPLQLPNGQIVRNRLFKSAMSETMAAPNGAVPRTMPALYRRWASGGVGLSITGNVMVDRRAIGEPGNVVIEDERDLDQLRAWAQAGRANDTRLYMQVNHPGRQAPRFLNPGDIVAPSAVEPKNPTFGTPRPLTEAEIEDLVVRYGRVAAIAEKAGFDGAQIHGAHGYLVSQFLSPLTNKRTDKWGGSPENRRRFAAEVYREMRRQTSPSFGVAIKINSADFQRGGTSEEESLGNIVALAEMGLDFVEISGGTFESPAMTGVSRPKTQSTIEREAYFLEFAETLRSRLKTPLGVTGGWRTGTAMAAAVASGSIDFVGMARGLAVYPDFPARVLADATLSMDVPLRKTGIAAIDKMALLELIWYERQLHRMGDGKDPRPNESPLLSMLRYGMTHGPKGFRTRRQR